VFSAVVGRYSSRRRQNRQITGVSSADEPRYQCESHKLSFYAMVVSAAVRSASVLLCRIVTTQNVGYNRLRDGVPKIGLLLRLVTRPNLVSIVLSSFEQNTERTLVTATSEVTTKESPVVSPKKAIAAVAINYQATSRARGKHSQTHPHSDRLLLLLESHR